MVDVEKWITDAKAHGVELPRIVRTGETFSECPRCGFDTLITENVTDRACVRCEVTS